MDAGIFETVERHISLERLSLFWNRSWPGFGLVGIANPTYYRPWPLQPLKINRMYWPVGASRYGFGLFLADTVAANSIALYAFGGQGDRAVPQDLVLSSEDQNGNTIESITFSGLLVMPPIPLWYVIGDDGNPDLPGYLICVVDGRWTWWNYPCPEFNISEQGSVSWTTIIAAIMTALNVSNYAVSTIPAAYLQPSRALNLTGEPIPPVLDAIAANIGCRLRYSYSGDVTIQSFSDSLDSLDADQAGNPQRSVRSGGNRYLDTL